MRIVSVQGLCWSILFLLSAFVSSDAYAQRIVVYEPWETVALEHTDRVRRLKRIAEGMGTRQPEFFEYWVSPEKHKLSEFPVDMPVLRVVYPEDVFFASDSSDLTDEALGIITNVAASLRKEPADVTVFIVGHTDGRGTEVYNLALGKRRAQSVARNLALRRVPQSQIYRMSFGEFAPVASNESVAGRARNRRVEFLFAARPEAIAVWLLEEQKNVLEMRARATSGHVSEATENAQLQPDRKETVATVRSKTNVSPDESGADVLNKPGRHEATNIDNHRTQTLKPEENRSEESFEHAVEDITIEAESVEVSVDDKQKTVLDVGRKKVVLNLTRKKSTLVTE